MSDTPPPVPVEPARRSLLQRASIVWVIPLLALVIALAVAWQAYVARGPRIEVEFQNGAGIAARETELRFRDVTVGVVEEVKFSDDLSSVVAYIRVDNEVAPYIDASANFWVVRPQLTARGVSGLDTVLTGVYIEGAWDTDIGPEKRRFTGQPDTPLIPAGERGLQIVLRSTPGGALTDNSPIIYRGIEVGRVGRASIAPEGDYAIAEAIIYEPHGRLVTPATRFWDVSGFSFSVGPQGAEIDFSSFATLVSGGITFDTFISGGGPVGDGTLFDVYLDEATARSSVFNASEVTPLEMRVVFEDNISGLVVDAPVELNGLKIGKVRSVSGIIDPDAFGDERVRLNAVLAIQPARLGLQDEVSAEAALAFLSARIEEGLRARLASASLLTGGLKIELVEVEGAPVEVVQAPEGIIPLIPTTDSQISDATDTVEGVISRINALPIEELLNSAIEFLDSAEAFVSDEDLRETPADVRALLGAARDLVASDEVQEVPAQLSAAIGRFEAILAQIQEDEVTARLAEALEAAARAADGVNSSVAGVPDLVERIRAVAAEVEEVPLTELAEEVTALVSSAEAILATEAARQLPADLGSALNEVNAVLADLRAGGAVESFNQTFASARKAADAVATSTEDLPQLVARVRRILDQASTTISGYDKGDVVSRDARAALRDVSQAADAIASLARMLERNPSLLIRGR